MTTVILPNVRLGFANLWRPGKPMARADGTMSTPKYGAHAIFAPGSDADKIMRTAFMEAATAKFGVNATNVINSLSKDKKCFRQGDHQLDKSGAIRNGYKGMLFVVTTSGGIPAIAAHRLFNGKPVLIGEDGKGYQQRKNEQGIDKLTDITHELPFEIKKPYGGCYVNLKLDVYGYEPPGIGKSIPATLLGVQFVGDGEAFGGGGPGTADGFGDMEPDAPPATSQSSAAGGDPFFGDAMPGAVAKPAEFDPFS